MPDGKSSLPSPHETGETEFWKYPANGLGKPEQLTNDAKVLRWDGVPSPDGRWLAHHNKDQQLWLFDLKSKSDKLIAQSMNDRFYDLAWSPDSQWLAYVEFADNTFAQIKLLNVNTGAIQSLTSDRYNSLQSRLEFRRQMALFPLRPHAQNHHPLALGYRASRIRISTAP